MYNAWIVARRELTAMFTQPIPYIFALVITGLTGGYFAIQITQHVTSAQFSTQSTPLTIESVMFFFSQIALFVTPAITMRLLSAEQSSGTIELLMTLPVRDGEVVFGKFLAAYIFYIGVMALTLVYPLILFTFGNPDMGPIITTYIGVLLAGAAMLGIGVLASALAENQIVSFITAFGVLLLLNFLLTPAGGLVGNIPALQSTLQALSFQHLNGFLDGLLIIRDVVYYLGLTAVTLFAAARVLESRRWR